MRDIHEMVSEATQRSTAKRTGAHSHSAADEPVRRLSLWTSLAALLIAATALALAVWVLLHPPNEAASPTDEQIAEAKGQACASYLTVRNAVSLQTNVQPGPDRVEAQAIAANARLAMIAGSEHLLSHLDPATPPQLADSMRSFAAILQDLTVTALAGSADNDPAQVARLRNAEATSAKIVEQCK